MDNTAMPEIMKMLGDKFGGDSSKITSILNMMQSNGNPSNHSENNSSTTSQSFNPDMSQDMPDIETIMKIKRIMDSMKANSNDPSVNLLSSLKPYMRDEKKTRIDQYIKLLSMGKAMSAFSNLEDESNDSKHI